MMYRLPNTRARLSTSITLRAFLDPDATDQYLEEFWRNAAMAAQGIGSSTTNLNIIGAAYKFSRKQSREIFKRYSLGQNAFEPRQIFPMKIKTSLSIGKVILYDVPILERIFNFAPKHLLYQKYPFVIHEQLFDPNDNILNSAIILYTQCWFITNPIEYDLSKDDILITQDLDIECGKVYVLDFSEGSLQTVSGLNITEPKSILKNVSIDILRR